MRSMSQAKGQMAIEFIIMTAIATVVAVAFLGATNTMLRDSVERERIVAMNDIGYTLQDEVILAATTESGYERIIVIPDKAGRFTYQLTAFDGGVLIESGPAKITYSLPSVTGTFAKGTNIITNNGGITIT